ncbi:MAG TPA: hypothetical protein VKA53_03610 [Thermoanaerobaculia bacterium]|nr:hypothetical protein [Thermoanaerobaculia bacterium]
MEKITIATAVRRQLDESLVNPESVCRALLEVPWQCSDRDPEVSIGVCEIPLPRPLDPETAQMRKLSCELRKRTDGWELVAVHGLDTAPESIFKLS